MKFSNHIKVGGLEAYKEIKGFAIIPIQSGDRVSINQQQVYFPIDQDLAKQLDKILSPENLPKIAFLDGQLSHRLAENRELLVWTKDNLGIVDFTISAYVGSTLVPWLYEHVEQINEKDLLAAVQIILEYWQEITDEDRKVICEKIPVLLDNGSIVRSDKLEGVELLVPRTLNKDKGWQLILKTEDDYGHEDVLSDNYLKLNMAYQESLDEFLSVINAQRYPDFRKYSGGRYSYNDTPYSEYVSVIFDAFNEDNSETPTLTSWMTPSFFHDETQLKNKKNRIAFLYWLQGMLENRSESLRYGKMNWFYYSGKSCKVDSGLYFYLTNISWISTSKGLKRPGEVFVRTKQTNEMFGSRLAYLKDDISPELCEFLGIKTEVTTETVLEYLRELSNQNEVNISLIKQLYKYLGDYGDEYAEYFHKEALIYIPGPGKHWYISSEVIWDDASQVLGDLYGWLSPEYEKTGLREFFVNKLEVRPSVDEKSLASAWLNLQQASDVSAAEVETKLSKILPKLLSLVKIGNGMPEWWYDFKEQVMVWSRNDKFVSSDDLYYNNNRYLSDLFSGDISFAWIPDTGNAVAYYAPLFDSLGVKPISESVAHYLKDEVQLVLEQKNKILTDYSKQLLAYLVYSEFGDEYREKMGEGALSSILRSVEACVDTLSIVYKVADWNVEKTVKDKSGFVDIGKQLIVRKTTSDDEEIKDDVAEFIARAIWGTEYRVAEDQVKAILVVASEERYRKLRDKKGWSMPREIMVEVEKLISQSAGIETSDEEEPRPERNSSGSTAREDSSYSSPGSGSGKTTTSTRNPRSSSGTGSQTVGRQSSNPTGSGLGRTGSRESRNADGQGRKSHSRSRDTTKKINSERQRRVVTYVYSHDNRNQHSSDNDNQNEEQQHRLSIGNAAEEAVVEHEKKYGRLASRMPVNNPGYDIESVCVQTGEARFIEVKGLDAEWGWKGVGISSTQYAEAQRRGDDYWLYVVEHALSDSPQVLEIPNPAKLITEYRFDGGWKQLVNFEQTERKGSPIVEDDISSLTDDSVCKLIVEACLSSNLPVPEVGYELFNEDGEVVSEFELAWENYLLAVTIHEYSDDVTSEGWAVFSNNEVKPVLDALEKAYIERLEK